MRADAGEQKQLTRALLMATTQPLSLSALNVYFPGHVCCEVVSTDAADMSELSAQFSKYISYINKYKSDCSACICLYLSELQQRAR